MRSPIRRLALLAVALCGLAMPTSALATSTPEQIATATASGVSYLKTLQAENGSFPGFGGDWSLTSLAAAGSAAADLRLTEKSTDARSYYRGESEYGGASWPGTGSPPVTDFERAALVSYAAGIDPARVSKRQNLIAKIASYAQTASPGYYGSTFNGTVFALLALAETRTTGGAQRVPQVVLDQAVEAVRANQHTDGGWTWEKAAGSEAALKKPSEPDMTGAAMAALCAGGVANTDPAIVAAKEYLAGLLGLETGAIESEFGANTDSNAWAVQGLNACGFDPQEAEFTTPGFEKTPIDFLVSQQLGSGAFKYLASESKANQYSSQDAVRALAGAGFTAEPPAPEGEPTWFAASEWGTGAGETAPLALILDYGGTLEVCSVSLAPGAGSTTLAVVLEAAVAATTPAGCVTGFLPAGGNGAITQINGYPEPKAAGWKISIDGSAAVQATRNTAIHLGDTIYLRYE